MSEVSNIREEQLEKLRQCAVECKRAREKRDCTIRESVRVGVKRIDIADALGLSKGRIDQIARGVTMRVVENV